MGLTFLAPTQLEKLIVQALTHLAIDLCTEISKQDIGITTHANMDIVPCLGAELYVNITTGAWQLCVHHDLVPLSAVVDSEYAHAHGHSDTVLLTASSTS